MRKIRAIKYNPRTYKTTEIEVKEDYTHLSKHIKCNWIDIINTTKDFEIVVDDEGNLKEGNIVSEVNGSRYPLSGILIFVGLTNEEGEMTSLDPKYKVKDIKNICQSNFKISKGVYDVR